ncbi:hypothetical protein ERJ75_000880600 [Trypanosoma vivax]|uniref:Uncharacterized protein n=1 Tax=Trypanosoma vivax (strain Y486) TaxID=1055687 RepID=G0TRC4_TRYVY|nr:hypothetical protein TRVL_06659 [Trypanosoma vivax]KAH8612517.1 hypothetical protein ERJ75_000880600 [Trypanosoma vivax]CCC46488.1 conserved hypothetical protein [Trypanosoma vivax Y486]
MEVGARYTLRRFGGSTPSVAYSRRFQGLTVSREVALARWNARSEDTAKVSGRHAGGKGMWFASAFASVIGATSSASTTPVTADVSWDVRERIDYYVQYSVPSNWLLVEQVSNNSVAIQCRPPLTKGCEEKPSVHGFSLNCFAYKQKVKEPDCAKLLNLFLERFNTSVSNSLDVLSIGTGRSSDEARNVADNNISEMIARRLNCAVAEVTFAPTADESVAHGLCRAFYNSNCRFHYVVVVAVPEDEYKVSSDLLTHALLGVVETRAEHGSVRP